MSFFFVFNVLFIIFVFNNCYRKEESDLQINYWHKIFLWTMMKFENPSKGIVAFIAVLHLIVIARPSIKCNNFVLQCTCLSLPLPVFVVIMLVSTFDMACFLVPSVLLLLRILPSDVCPEMDIMRLASNPFWSNKVIAVALGKWFV
jgi:hypothetical protein